MPTDPPPDLLLTPLHGDARPIEDWVTLFPLAVVALDPYTYESAWLLEEAGRILTSFSAADVRVGWLVTATADEARSASRSSRLSRQCENQRTMGIRSGRTSGAASTA